MLGEKISQVIGVEPTGITELKEALEMVDVDGFVQRIVLATTSEAIEMLHDLILKEQFLTENNSLKAYAEKLPSILEMLEISRLKDILTNLETPILLKALFGNFRAVSSTKLIKIFDGLPILKVAQMLEEMILGVDLPKKAAKVLSELSPRKSSLVVHKMSVQAVCRIFREMERSAISRILERTDIQKALELCDKMLGNRNEVRICRLKGILREMEKQRSISLWIRFSPKDRQKLCTVKRNSSPWNAISLKKILTHFRTMPPDGAARILGEIETERQLELLKRLDADFASRVVSHLALQQPKFITAILEEMIERILIPNAKCNKEIVYSNRAICIRERLSPNLPDLKQRPQPFRSNYPVRSGWGVKRSIILSRGVKSIHIEETLKTESKTKQIVIDILELDPSYIRIKCYRSIEEKDLIPVGQIDNRLKDVGQDNPDRTETKFKELGLVRLAEVVNDLGAIAGINGGFYFDYGHYLDSRKIGHDLSRIPGLCYGDLVGWFVSDGVESSPPIANRGSLVVTKAGEIQIIKVFMTGVTLPNGNILTWDDENSEKTDGRTILFNSQYGRTTKSNPHYIDLTIARNRIYGIVTGNAVPIPVSGFVLSLPTEKAALLEAVRIGDRVNIENDFPKEMGKVDQAISCGPQLVRDGQPELDFDYEGFGAKDTLVVPFSLTRAVDIFEAARSFVMIKDDKLFLGTVSGTSFGSGPPKISAGMTFGELAQLAVDLGADQALALDGGGSSSIVHRTANETKILNIPTGGSDVPQGSERFINTYLVVFQA